MCNKNKGILEWKSGKVRDCTTEQWRVHSPVFINSEGHVTNKTQCMFWFLDITILWIYFLPAELHFSKFQTPLKWRQNRIWKQLLLWASRSPLEGSVGSVANITCCNVTQRALFLHVLPVEFIWLSEYRWLPQTRVTNWSFSWRSDTFSGRQKSIVKRFI
jgi:hypothetical protein